MILCNSCTHTAPAEQTYSRYSGLLHRPASNSCTLESRLAIICVAIPVNCAEAILLVKLSDTVLNQNAPVAASSEERTAALDGGGRRRNLREQRQKLEAEVKGVRSD